MYASHERLTDQDCKNSVIGGVTILRFVRSAALRPNARYFFMRKEARGSSCLDNCNKGGTFAINLISALCVHASSLNSFLSA